MGHRLPLVFEQPVQVAGRSLRDQNRKLQLLRYSRISGPTFLLQSGKTLPYLNQCNRLQVFVCILTGWFIVI